MVIPLKTLCDEMVCQMPAPLCRFPGAGVDARVLVFRAGTLSRAVPFAGRYPGVSALCTVGATSRRYVVCLVGLPFVMPYLAVMVRRLHDCGRSGWWAGGYLAVSIAGRVVSHFSLKPGGAAWLTDADLGLAILQGVYLIFLFYWWCRPGVPGENKYGPDPKAE